MNPGAREIRRVERQRLRGTPNVKRETWGSRGSYSEDEAEGIYPEEKKAVGCSLRSGSHHGGVRCLLFHRVRVFRKRVAHKVFRNVLAFQERAVRRAWPAADKRGARSR